MTTRHNFDIKARAAMSHIEDAERHLKIADELCAELLQHEAKTLKEARIVTEIVSRALLLCGRPSAISASLGPHFTGTVAGESGEEGPRSSGSDFAARIRDARLKAGLSRQELASLLGMTRAAIHSWEKGITRPRDARLPFVADTLGVSVADLLYGDDDR